MLLVILSWCYIFGVGLNLGLAFDRIFRLQLKDTVTILFAGLFSVTILAGFWAIFGRINWEFQLFLLLLNGLVLLWNWTRFSNHLRNFYGQLKGLAKGKLVLLWLSLGTYALVCAAPPYFADHEIYYIQTVKWLNEYGFVKGLANLHLFFGQTSGWHILQGVFSFSFLGMTLHTLNGFCLLVGNIYAILNVDNFKAAALFPLANLLLFPFLAVASADLAVCVIAFVAFCHFLRTFEYGTPQAFNTLAILCLFVVFIKITAAPILLLPLFIWISNCRALFKKVAVSYFAAILVFGLFVVKNTILTGYPLFPSTAFAKLFTVDFTVPTAIHDLAFNPARRYDFFIPQNRYASLNGWQILVRWVFGSGLNSVFNAAIVLLLLAIPLLKVFSEKKYRVLYAVMAIQLLLLFATSPQHRFMLHFVLLFGLLAMAAIAKNNRLIPSLGWLSLVPLLAIGCFGLHFPSRNIQFSDGVFSAGNLIIPSKNSNLEATYYKVSIGNLDYFSPDQKTYIWATGDGALPCVNQKQIQYLSDKTGYIPQLRTNHLKDGFCAVKITP
jgi:hypothetical protein